LDRVRLILYCDYIISFCLCLAVFCIPFAKAGVETFIWMAIFIWILKRVLGYRGESLGKMLPKTELNMVIGIFLIVNLLSMIFSANFGLSLRGFFGKIFKFIAIYFMIIETMNTKKRLRNLLIAIIASVVLLMSDAGAQYFTGRDFLRGYEFARLRASFATVNGFGAWLIVVMPLLCGILISEGIFNKKIRPFLVALIGLSAACLLMTYSRGAWLGFTFSLLFVVSYYIRRLSLKAKITTISLAVFLFTALYFLPQPIKIKSAIIVNKFLKSGEPSIGKRMRSITSLEDLSNKFRINFWKESIAIIEDYPLTGCGLNTYSIVARNYKVSEFGGIYPHNSILQMAAETGLLGISAFLLILITLFRLGMKKLKESNDYLVLYCLAAVLAFFTHSFFDNLLFSLPLVVLFWFTLGLTVAVIKIES